MPKFASNLGFQPLEPQKTVPSTSTQNETQPVEVPDAKFDWTSSGLVNPLDCKYLMFLSTFITLTIINAI